MERAWLVELRPSVAKVPTYYGRTDEGVLGWTRAADYAVRFCRKVDAELVIDDLGLTEAYAVEHQWG